MNTNRKPSCRGVATLAITNQGAAPGRAGRTLWLAPLLVLASTFGPGCGTAEPQIEQATVERIITRLASDEMGGRRAFTPQADAAAGFIAEEFTAIGLDTFAGADGHQQRFAAYSLQVQRSEVWINSVAVPGDNVIVSAGGRSIDWNTGDGTAVVVVGADDNPMQGFQAARRGGVNTLLLVNNAHRELFERLSGFLSRPSQALQLDGPSTVMVLTETASVASYRASADVAVGEQALTNVVGVIPGERADEIVLFAAHYDHIGVVAEVDGDGIANGANDDASGTTAVIELARYFKAMGRPERTLVFVAFTAEEVGGFGSRYFSEQLAPERIVAMFNIEMIGKVSAQGPATAWITGFERSDFGTILQAAVEGTKYGFYPDPYPEQNLFYRSDNATLARLGVPAHTISTTQIDIDEDYHHVSDEVETLDLGHLTDTIRAIVKGAAPIISGTATPSRIDPSTVR